MPQDEHLFLAVNREANEQFLYIRFGLHVELHNCRPRQDLFPTANPGATEQSPYDRFGLQFVVPNCRPRQDELLVLAANQGACERFPYDCFGLHILTLHSRLQPTPLSGGRSRSMRAISG
jgi:hypothetical protein